MWYNDRYMSPQERNRGERRHQPHQLGEPLHPTPLPRELRTFLREQRLVCLPHATDQGTLFIVKAPTPEIDSVRGLVPVALHHELYEFPTAPVIRMVTTIYDRPERPLRLESFTNVGAPDQRATYAGLATQEQTHFLFYDERLHHRLTKQVGGLDRDRIAAVLQKAVELYEAIPEAQYNFDVAKAWVLAHTDLR